MYTKTIINNGISHKIGDVSPEERERIIDAARHNLIVEVDGQTLRFNLWTSPDKKITRAYVQISQQHKTFLNAADSSDLNVGNDDIIEYLAAWLDAPMDTPEPMDTERIEREFHISQSQL